MARRSADTSGPAVGVAAGVVAGFVGVAAGVGTERDAGVADAGVSGFESAAFAPRPLGGPAGLSSSLESLNVYTGRTLRLNPRSADM